MPLTRYQIRNEYSLADPELYIAADKDDPEALLEGVAMAGLVGVLRELGDLAEFAAEIFHDLHEEVMVTAARCHGLMVRVQQLEAEFPSIEKAFLSQTSHSLFFYNPGVDWHPNLRMDQNLITQGDLPRFVMDSYEECRGPPRLFLLDKFDVAGAGACLKRYTDPSFFKAEAASSGMTNSEVQREKKTRKAKKKGSRWRNGETPEVLPTSHAKLHQLFLEESVENHINDPARRLKLKRRLNGFPFDLKTRESYMDKLLNTPTPDQNDVREISVNLPPSKLPSDDTGESGIEIPEISTVSPGKEVSKRKRSPRSSPDVEETGQKPSIDELREEVDYGISELPKLKAISDADNILPTLHEDVNEKEILEDRERKIQDSSDGYESDDIASEVDNYMDALTTMDSEVETDMECKAKNVQHFLNIENQGRDSDANEEQQYLQAFFSDSQSIGNSAATDDGNSSSTKEISSFSYSNSVSNLAEHALSDGDVSSKTLAANEICGAEIVNISSEGRFVNDESPSTQAYEHTVYYGSITSYRSDAGEPSPTSCLTDSTPMTFPGDTGKNSMEVASKGPELDETSPNRNGLNTTYINLQENMACLGDNFTCTSSHSNVQSQTRDDFLSKQSSKDHSVDELDDGDPHVLSHASLLRPSNIFELASEKRISENRLDDMLQTAYAKGDCPKETVDRQIDSPHSVAAHMEEHHDSALPEPEICDPDMKPDGIVSEMDNAPPFSAETVIASTPMVDGLQAINFTKQQSLGISENIPPLELDSVEEGFLYSGKINLDGASNAAEGEDLGGFSTDMDMAGKNDTNVKFPSDLQSLPDSTSTANADLVGVVTETVHSDVVVAIAIASTHCDDNGNDGKSLSSSPKLKEESTAILQDLLQNDMEISPQVHLQEADSVKEVDRLAVASSDLDSVVCNTVPCEESNSELLNSVRESSNAAISENSLHSASVTTVPLSSNQHDQDLESRSHWQIDVSLHVTDASTVLLSTDCDQDLKSESARQIDVIEKDDADAATVPLSSDQRDQDSESKSARQIDVNENDDANATTVPFSSDQHDQDSESKSARQIDVNENDDADATTVPSSSDQHDQDSESKSARRIDVNENDDANATTVPFSLDQHDQDSESKSAGQIDVNENDDADATTVPSSSDQHDQDSESKSARQIDVNENNDADATTVPLSSDQNDHDQDSESKSAQLIDVIENDGVSSQVHHIAEPRTPLEQKAELQSDQFDVESWHDQDLESKYAQQPDVILNGILSSPSHHIPVPRTPLEQKSELQSDQFDVESWIDLVSESVSVQQINVSDNAEGNVPSPTYHIAEPIASLEQNAELQSEQFDVESWHADNASFNPFSIMEQIQSPNHLDQERHGDASSEICAACVPSQPSVSEFFAQLDVSEQAKDPSRSTLPSFGLLPEVSQISMDEMPPLPPLPPMQWRMGKVQHPSVSLERDSAGSNLDCIPENLPVEGEITQPSNPFLPLSSLKDENIQHGQENLAGYMVHSNPLSLQVPTLVNHGNSNDDFPTSGTAYINPFLELPTIHREKSERGFIASEGGIEQPIVNPFSSVPSVEGTISKYPSTSLLENLVQPLHQSAPETSWEDGKLQGTSVISEGKAINPPDTISPTSMIQYDQPRHVFSTSEGQTDLPSGTSASLPDGKPNGNSQVKLPRPRNPLFDDVTALDKSKLRKVTERVRPQMVQKVDERDSLLEQIRTKSFNLRPAASTRPSIQGPKTNIKVAAILDKANAIRQAWAGSDEDDDADSWSDS